MTQHPRVFAVTPFGSTECRHVVKVLSSRRNECQFLTTHRAMLSQLRVLAPTATLSEFVPGMTAVVMPHVTALRQLDGCVLELLLPQLVEVLCCVTVPGSPSRVQLPSESPLCP